MTLCSQVRQTLLWICQADRQEMKSHQVEMVTDSQPLPELSVSETSDRGCFFSLAPEKHKGTIQCFLNMLLNSTCHYVREPYPGSPSAPVLLLSPTDDCICPFALLLSTRPVWERTRLTLQPLKTHIRWGPQDRNCVTQDLIKPETFLDFEKCKTN